MMDLRTIQHSILIGRHRIIVNNLNKKRSKVLFQLYIAPFLKFQLWDATMLIVDTDAKSIKPVFYNLCSLVLDPITSKLWICC